jgi:hypothetical protein
MWTAVPGYEGIYEAQRTPPAVRSLDRVIIDKRGQIRMLRGRVLAGYGGDMVMLSRDGEQKLVPVAEVMEWTFRQPIAA